MERLSRLIERVLVVVCWLAFAGLVGVVFLQVFARNVLEQPMIWTLDIAQLLFSWCVFLGAALALRRGAHFSLDVLPERLRRTNALLKLFADVSAGFVAVLLLWGGWRFTLFGFNRTSEAIGISEAYFVAPIPIAATCMAIFSVPILFADARALAAAWRRAP